VQQDGMRPDLARFTEEIAKIRQEQAKSEGEIARPDQGRGKGCQRGRRWLLAWKAVSEEQELRCFVESALIYEQKRTEAKESPVYWRKEVTGRKGCCTDVLKPRERGFGWGSSQDLASDWDAKI